MTTVSRDKKKAPRVLSLDPRRVKPFPGQPRKRFTGIPALAESIKTVGQVTPIIVRPSDDPDFDAVLVDGERRLRACLLAKRRIRAVYGGEMDDEECFARSVAANFCRQPHDAIEISEAIWRLKAAGKTREQISATFGRSPCWVDQHASLAGLAPELRAMLERPEGRQSKKESRRRGRIDFCIALSLLPLEHAGQVVAARHIVAKQLSFTAARNYVRSLAADAEMKKLIKPGSRIGRPAGPAQQWTTLANAADSFRNIIARFASMRHSDFDNVLTAAGRIEANRAAHLLKAAAEDLAGVYRAIRRKFEG